jgi:hypothetical protein
VDWLLTTGAVIGAFVLRLGVPLAITLAVAYWLRRLDAKWEAEAWTQWKASRSQKEGTADPKPCWTLKGCGETARAGCPAFTCAAPIGAGKQPKIPCWLARRRAEGKLPATCYNCELFSPRQIAQGLAS